MEVGLAFSRPPSERELETGLSRLAPGHLSQTHPPPIFAARRQNSSVFATYRHSCFTGLVSKARPKVEGRLVSNSQLVANLTPKRSPAGMKFCATFFTHPGHGFGPRQEVAGLP